MLHTVSYNNIQYSVVFTRHTTEIRSGETIPRDAFIYPSMAKALLTKALQYGLTSFRNKDQVVITARIGEEYAISFVLNITRDNVIKIHTVMTHPFAHHYIFIKTMNRINLWDLVFPSKSVIEVKAFKVAKQNTKQPKNFKRSNVVKMRLEYQEGTASHAKNEIDSYTTTYNHKRRLD